MKHCNITFVGFHQVFLLVFLVLARFRLGGWVIVSHLREYKWQIWDGEHRFDALWRCKL